MVTLLHLQMVTFAKPPVFFGWCVAFRGQISSEIYWYYFHCPKNVLCSILSFVFWIFPPLDTAVQLESADSKQNAISKSLFQDSFRHIFWAMRKMHHTFFKKKKPLALHYQLGWFSNRNLVKNLDFKILGLGKYWFLCLQFRFTKVDTLWFHALLWTIKEINSCLKIPKSSFIALYAEVEWFADISWSLPKGGLNNLVGKVLMHYSLQKVARTSVQRDLIVGVYI